MSEISRIADGCVREVADDYVSLWQISGRVRDALSLVSNEEVKDFSLEVIRLIVNRGLRPGDYYRMGFRFWNEGDLESIVTRIDREWDPLDGDPTLANPICWFASK